MLCNRLRRRLCEFYHCEYRPSLIVERRLDITNYFLILHGSDFVEIPHADMQKHKVATNCSFALEFLMQLTQDV